MQVLFLDIDGVLNRRSTRERCNGLIGVDRELSTRLLRWLRPAGVSIVLSSTWRKFPDMHAHLHQAGIRWIDITPQSPDGHRGREIQQWLDGYADARGVSHYAILDDDSDMLPEQLPRFVHTENAVGLQDEHIDRLKKLFS